MAKKQKKNKIKMNLFTKRHHLSKNEEMHRNKRITNELMQTHQPSRWR